MNEDVLVLDGVEYNFTFDEVFKTQKLANKLLVLAKGTINMQLKDIDKGGFKFDIDPVAALANMDCPEIDAIQEFILSTIQVVKDGAGIPFTSKIDKSTHFGENRSHLYQVILFGGKFHFTPFLPTGREFAKSMIGQVINKTLARV